MFHQPGPDWRAGLPYQKQPGLETHIAFVRRLHDEGRLVLGGPFGDEESGGMLIVKSPSLEDATALANEDSSIGRLLHVNVRPWHVAMAAPDAAAAVRS